MLRFFIVAGVALVACWWIVIGFPSTSSNAPSQQSFTFRRRESRRPIEDKPPSLRIAPSNTTTPQQTWIDQAVLASVQQQALPRPQSAKVSPATATPTASTPTPPHWFAIRRGAGCLKVHPTSNIIHFANCRDNDASQLWRASSTRHHHIISKTNHMCLTHATTTKNLIVDTCKATQHTQHWVQDRASNVRKAQGVTAAPHYTGVRLHTKDFQCVAAPTLVVESWTTWPNQQDTSQWMTVRKCNAYDSTYFFKDISKERFYFVQEKRIQRPVVVVLPEVTATTTLLQVQQHQLQFEQKFRKVQATAPLLFVHLNGMLGKDDQDQPNQQNIFKSTKNNVYHFDATDATLFMQKIEHTLATFSSDQILLANVESALTSESDVQVLSNTLEKNPGLIGAGGFLIGQGSVLHRNCYTAVNAFQKNTPTTKGLGWVAGYNALTVETKHAKRCMVCDRVAMPLLSRKKDVGVLLRLQLSFSTATATGDAWQNQLSSPLWMTTVVSTPFRPRRLASCPHFVALNDAFAATATVLNPPGIDRATTSVFPITTTWKEESPCRNKQAKQEKKALAMWEMLKGTLHSLQQETTFVGSSIQSGFLMQSLKLGTIAPWDHDIDLDLAFSDCGSRKNIYTSGPGQDVAKGCKRFLPAIKNLVNGLQKSKRVGIPDGFGKKRWMPNNQNLGWANVRMKVPFAYRQSAWADVCERGDDFILRESWHDCLAKLRKDSKKTEYQTYQWLQMDLHVKPGIQGSKIHQQLFIDLVGPSASDELRVGLHYDKATRALWHMEYIDIQYGSSWLEHPWDCPWKYQLAFR